VIKHRIKHGLIKTTSEFHRDVLLMLANAIMYNDSSSDIYRGAVDMLDFVDSELHNFLVHHS
jgi:Bromodomain